MKATEANLFFQGVPQGKVLDFAQHDDGTVSTSFRGDTSLEGYRGLIHGGILSTLLDTAMAQCLMAKGVQAVTGELTVRFLQPVDSRSIMEIKAWVESSLPPLYHLKSQIRVAGTLVCKAKAKFMQNTAALAGFAELPVAGSE